MGLELVQLVAFSRKAGERLVAVGPHLHFKIITISFETI
jgi:hypothetical protein